MMDPDKSTATGSACSICLDLVLDPGDRAICKLNCGHEFHLDCIGSAFNAKGQMQCPNCRKVEKGRWLYANGLRVADMDIDGWFTGDVFDIGYPDIFPPLQWCPYRGFTQISSLFEEGEVQPSTYRAAADHSSSSSGSHGCPYLALHGFIPPTQLPPNSSETSFHHYSGSSRGQPTAQMNYQNFPPELRYSDQEHGQGSNLYTSGFVDLPSHRFGGGTPQSDGSSGHRFRSLHYSSPPLHGNATHNGSNLTLPIGLQDSTETRTHTYGLGGHSYCPAIQTRSHRNPSLPSTRRVRPRNLGLTPILAASSSSEARAHQGFTVSGSSVRNHSDGESLFRNTDGVHGWSDIFAPIPWIPAEGEPSWWGAFNPTQGPFNLVHNPRPANLAQRTVESSAHRGSDTHHHMPLHPRAPPFL